MVSPFDIQAELGRCGDLRQAQLDALIGDGVPVDALVRNALGWPSVICRDRVVFSEDGRTFEFERDVRHDSARGAYVVPCLDEDGNTIDIAAWRPGMLATWLGRAPLLGGEMVDVPRLGEPLNVHETVFDWLRAGREGVVVIDPRMAVTVLTDAAPLAVSTVAFGRTLRAMLHRPPPRIVVEVAKRPQGQRTDLLDNIQEVPNAPTGTSREAGLRKLQNAAAEVAA